MGSEVAQLLEAADFAAHKHRRQRRMDPEGTPYINHPIGGRAARGVTSAASGGTGWGGSGTALSTCSAPSFGRAWWVIAPQTIGGGGWGGRSEDTP